MPKKSTMIELEPNLPDTDPGLEQIPPWFIELNLKYCKKCLDRVFVDANGDRFCNINLDPNKCPYLSE
jgi:hypothetical protein